MIALAADTLRVRLGGRDVLDGVTLALEPGRITAVIGPNGAGKSTLLACLAGLRKPDSGQVCLGGRSIATLGHRARAQQIGFLPQLPEIAWAVDVETLVGLGRTPYTGVGGLSLDDREAVARALVAADAAEFARRDVTTLSGGERARVLIARALAGEPQWLLADEPFAGLDPGHQLDAAALFRSFADQGRGVVLTLHDLALAARLADRIIVLANGGIVADAVPAEALTPAVLARAYAIEARLLPTESGPLIEIVGRARV